MAVSWLVFAGCVIGVGVLTAVLATAAHKVSIGHADEDPTSGLVYAVLYTLYAVILGFSVSTSWNNYIAAVDSVENQAASIIAVGRNAAALPDGAGRPVLEALHRYVVAEIGIAAQADRSDGAEESIARGKDVATAIGSVAGSDGIADLRGQMLESFADAEQSRTSWHELRDDSAPAILWALLIGGGLLTVGSATLLHYRRPSLVPVLLGAVAALITAALFTIYALQDPGTGPFPVSISALDGALAALDSELTHARITPTG